MARYDAVRSASPQPAEQRLSEEQRNSMEKPGPENIEAEQSEGLLSSGTRDMEKLGPTTPVVNGEDRKRFWIIVAGIVLTVLMAFDAWLFFVPHDKTQSSPPASTDPHLDALMRIPFQRSEEEYILNPKWDFEAPPQVRTYNWTIVDKQGNPDGVYKPMMMINGQFPGPMMEVNEGDTVIVNVKNAARNATGIHWHGLLQNGTNFMDGVGGVTQCPIAPGGSFQYNFTLTGQQGTYYYHAHQGVQMLSGLVGPLVIHSKNESATSTDPYTTDRVILLQDWYHDPAEGLLRDSLSPGNENSPIPNGALINGMNKVDCALHPNRTCDTANTLLPSMDMMAGAYHRLRFVNAGGFAWFQVAIDDHLRLLVHEVDGTPVKQFQEADITLSPGQRYSVTFATDQAGFDFTEYWLRARMIEGCFSDPKLPDNGVSEAKMIMRYVMPTGMDGTPEAPSNATVPTSTVSNNGTAVSQVLPTSTNSLVDYAMQCKDMTARNVYKPVPELPAPAVADHSWYFRVNMAIGDWRLERGFMNQSSFRSNLKEPTLHRLVDGLASGNDSFSAAGKDATVNDAAFHPDHELVLSHDRIETVDIILQNVDEGNHPFHLHGMPLWVLGQGHGYFPGYEALGLKPHGKGLLDPANDTVVANPLRRDTVTLEGFGWTLLRFVADNPGVWLFHCHMVWHAEAGMGLQIISRLRDLKGWEVPEANRQLCDAAPDVLSLGAAPPDEVFAGFHDE
ncbi:Laccase-1 [Apiospora hydei]|uniref:Laccase-1 n=1 Tax=Apiospora hydei TaxID=1337664 RepID=A0ABR1WPY6_9PEZI